MDHSFKIKDLSGVIDDLKGYFHQFSPKAYHFWCRPDTNDYKVQVIQQRFIAKLDEMMTCDLPLVRPMDYYDWYVDQYRAFHEQRPEMVDRVPVNTRELMDACLDQGMLYQLVIDGHIVGLIAGEMETFLEEPNLYIDEILIASEFRGQGYAKQLLASFAHKVDAKYLTCYIDSENVASTRTALGVGEVVFSQECAYRL